MRTTKIKIIREGEGVILEVENLAVASKNEDNGWTFFCPSLKVLGYSNESEENALKDFEENLNFFFEIHVEDNTLDIALESFNWKTKRIPLARKIDVVKGNKTIHPKIEFTNPDKKHLRIPTRNFRVPIHA